MHVYMHMAPATESPYMSALYGNRVAARRLAERALPYASYAVYVCLIRLPYMSALYGNRVAARRLAERALAADPDCSRALVLLAKVLPHMPALCLPYACLMPALCLPDALCVGLACRPYA